MAPGGACGLRLEAGAGGASRLGDDGLVSLAAELLQPARARVVAVTQRPVTGDPGAHDLAARLGDRGMSLVLTGRNKCRLEEVANQIRRAAPRVKVETVTADLSTGPGVSALLAHIGDRPIDVSSKAGRA